MMSRAAVASRTSEEAGTVRVVVAYPSLEEGGPLLEAGAAQARAGEATLVVLHQVVLEPVATGQDLARQTRRLENLETFLGALTEEVAGPQPWRVELALTQPGHAPARRLLDRLRVLDPSLVVLGRRSPNDGDGLGAIGGHLLRSVACPVLIVPLPRRGAGPAVVA